MISVLLRLFLLFLLSFVANATAFFGASYTLIATAELAATGVDLQSFLLVVLVTAVGATLGKMVIYYSALGLHRTLQKNKNVRLLGTWLGKSGFYLGLFVTALLPALPLDDYVYIGAGANRGRLAPMLGVTFLAKLAKSAFEILLELSGLLEISKLTHHLLGLSRLDLSIVASAAFVVLGIAIYKVDWEPIVVRVGKLFGRKPA
ncbi:MAG: VTT domain-containing protein [Thaumarchaeota archaeon]|nr:VTT domain-containing protein [Nitrososphaerota archaeon]